MQVNFEILHTNKLRIRSEWLAFAVSLRYINIPVRFFLQNCKVYQLLIY